MIGEGYRSFREATTFDDGYRRPKDDANGDGRYFVKPAKTARKSPESIQNV